MGYYLGIDGGGTHLRTLIVDDNLRLLAQTNGQTANPNHVGRNTAATRIQNSILETLHKARLQPESILAAGIGIAGASAKYARDWLLEVTAFVLPTSDIVPGSDVEIALVGAHGTPEGVLVLAGTGSVAYGINEHGETWQSGGWGYLLGDEGSGYWIGIQALQHITRKVDARNPDDDFPSHEILAKLGLQTVQDLLLWLYQDGYVSQVAALAPIILKHASEGNSTAKSIVNHAASELETMCHAVVKQLQVDSARVAFSGGLLENDTYLSKILERKLVSHYTLIETKFSPAVGAAIMAKIKADDSAH